MQSEATLIKWGILGTSRVAWRHFLPALRVAGGKACSIASRDEERAKQFAHLHDVQNAVASYAELLKNDSIQAVYIALPNALHAEWTINALRAGKTVLCEKPLCLSAEQTEAVIISAHKERQHLWEAFVFPFHRQMSLLQSYIKDGVIGDIREIQCNFHVPRDDRKDIRFSFELGGGALNDLGCYCVHLGSLLIGGEPVSAVGTSFSREGSVDEDVQAILNYDAGRRLMFSCGLLRPYDPFTRIVGSSGEIRLTNPFHPSPRDSLLVSPHDEYSLHQIGDDEPSFAAAIRHINAVVSYREDPRHTAVEEALPTARGLDLIRRAMHPQTAA